MVSQKKKDDLKVLKKLLDEYSVISIIDLYKLPSGQLHSIKKDIRKDATVKMSKKRIIKLAFEQSKKKNLAKLMEEDIKEPALIFSNINPFKLFKIIEKNKSPAYAKGGDTAPMDIIIPEGPTKLMAGPAIGDFQKNKIPAKVQDGKIHVIKDKKVTKKDEEITEQIADLLKKLGIQTTEVGIYIVSSWEDGVIFGREVLDVDDSLYMNNLQLAVSQAVNLSVNVAYPTKETAELLIIKAHREARNLGMEAEILEKDLIEELLAKGESQAKTLKAEIKLE